MPGFNIGNVVANKDSPSTTENVLTNYRWFIRKLGPVSLEVLRFAKELTLPTVNIEPQEVLGGTIHYKYARMVKFEDASVILYDDGNIFDQLNAWYQQVYTSKAGIQQHNAYKQECEFVLINGAGNEVESITLKGAWPKRITHGKLSYSDNNLKVMEVTISYDYFLTSMTSGASGSCVKPAVSKPTVGAPSVYGQKQPIIPIHYNPLPETPSNPFERPISPYNPYSGVTE